MKLLLIFLLGIITIGLGLWSGNVLYAKIKHKKNKNASIIQIALSAILFLASFVVFLIVPFSIYQVDAGEVAVVKVWGDAKEIRTSGIHYDLWISHKYEIYDAKVQQTIIETSAYSSDGQTMEVELVVQYQIQTENVLMIAKNYGGLDMLESRIKTVAIEKMKAILSQKSAMTIIETRTTVSPAVESNIRNAITSDYYVNITSVVLTNIDFTDAFEKTVEDKMIAEQEKLKAQYEKEKAIIQAEQELETAKLKAEAQIAEAQADAKAIEVVANANAKAIKIKSIEIARMMGFTITETEVENGVEYNIDFTSKTPEEIKIISDYLKYIEYLEVWDGKLPETIVGDSNASILIPTNPK